MEEVPLLNMNIKKNDLNAHWGCKRYAWVHYHPFLYTYFEGVVYLKM